MSAGAVFCLVRRPRRYEKRRILNKMDDIDVVERYRMSRERIEWLIDVLRDELTRNTKRNHPLSPETQVIVFIL